MKSRFPVQQMHSKTSFLPKLEDCIITKSLVSRSSYSLCPVDRQASVAVIQKVSKGLLSCPGLGVVVVSLCCFYRASATVKDEGTVCESDVKPWCAGQNTPRV